MPTIGKYSLHDNCNNNGLRAVDFATGHNLAIGSTCFKHKNIHKATWKSPDGQTFNQIDHVMIDGRHISNLLDVRTYRGANIDSDHYMVACKIRARISTVKQHKSEREQKLTQPYL